jgi:hypothetical protein
MNENTAKPELNIRVIQHTKRKRRSDGLNLHERVAIRLFYDRGVRAAILARVYKVSRNTIYYSALLDRGGRAATEVEEYLKQWGPDNVYRDEVTAEEILAVNAALVEAASEAAA